ncbi:LysR family transcriptional regulator [Vibrio ulleungensis]|uniref:LysR family transcriptional regulator n=1 Tax=Vibrio ulleungensis TaxID=2807619 RepID=A0ABS2HHH0_9VIBR|nr:LysR family transcriptional regulator [Vibrio ulleungensis]MBM7036126.1 LysR family transcriptional regulator [Vibrio ulleungensis]
MFDSQLMDGFEIFVEVNKQGSFTKAASSTGHSTSYISKEISKLEERLGVRLMQRTTRSLKLTPEGDVFLRRCEQIVHDARDAIEQVTGSQREPQGKLRVSAPIGFSLAKLKPLLSEFSIQFPKVELQIELSDKKIDLIDEGVDIAIRAASSLDDSSLISRRLLRSNGLVLASPAYLTIHGEPQHPADLSGHKAITYSLSANPELWEFEDKQGEQLQVKVDSVVQTNSPEMELQMCKSGLGIVRLPSFHLDGELQRGELVELFKDYPKHKLDIFVVYPSRQHLSAKVRTFIDFIFQKLGND